MLEFCKGLFARGWNVESEPIQHYCSSFFQDSFSLSIRQFIFHLNVFAFFEQ